MVEEEKKTEDVVLVSTIELQRGFQLHQRHVVVQSFGSVSVVEDDSLHCQRLCPIGRLLRHAHVHRPHGRVGEAEGDTRSEVKWSLIGAPGSRWTPAPLQDLEQVLLKSSRINEQVKAAAVEVLE